MKKNVMIILALVAMLLLAGCTNEPAEHVHQLNKVAGTAATCTSTGIKDYWVCSGCNKLYADANANTEIVVDYTLTEQLTIPMLAHSYVDDKDCTTDNKCKNCDAVEKATHEKHEAKDDDGDCTTAVTCKNCSVVLVEKKTHTGGTATCSAQATCTTCGKAYGSKDAHAHDFSGAIYIWADDFSTCIAAGACKRCGDAVFEEVATTYANGKIYADFATPALSSQSKVINNHAGRTMDQISTVVAYMIRNGETSNAVLFPNGNGGIDQTLLANWLHSSR